MEKLWVTVVGQDLFGIVGQKIELVGFNNINQVNRGMLGNLKTLTLELDILENEVIAKRTHLMDKLAEDNMRLMPMYKYGDWMRIIVTKPF